MQSSTTAALLLVSSFWHHHCTAVGWYSQPLAWYVIWYLSTSKRGTKKCHDFCIFNGTDSEHNFHLLLFLRVSWKSLVSSGENLLRWQRMWMDAVFFHEAFLCWKASLVPSLQHKRERIRGLLYFVANGEIVSWQYECISNIVGGCVARVAATATFAAKWMTVMRSDLSGSEGIFCEKMKNSLHMEYNFSPTWDASFIRHAFMEI